MNKRSTHATLISPAGSDVIAVGFGTAVAMWAVLYVCMTPVLAAVGWVVTGLMGVCLLGGGWSLGRWAGRGLGGGAVTGLVVWLVNLLLLSGMLRNDPSGDMATAAGKWFGGFAAAAVALMGLGAGVGRRTIGHDAKQVNWVGVFAVVTACTTGLLIVAGGVVTGLEAGLAVPDWPNTFDHPMIFYPLSLMQRDGHVYAEHAHRLWGTLVGLTMIVLMVQVFRGDTRRRARWMVVAAFVAVCVQGTLGGLRVTELSTVLAMTHGVLGQLILALIVAVACYLSTTWRSDDSPRPHPSAHVDHALSLLLLFMLVAQLAIGAAVRHYALHGLLTHVAVASLIFLAALICGMRMLGVHPDQPLLKRLGLTLMLLVAAQVVLGIIALVMVTRSAKLGETTAGDVLFTTLHQANGAALLAAATAVTLFTRRLLAPAADPRVAPQGSPDPVIRHS